MQTPESGLIRPAPARITLAAMLVVGLSLCGVSLQALTEESSRPLDTRNLLFSRLDIEDGLSQPSVSAIVQDGAGYIWIGTQEGLNRYDGTRIEVYEHQNDKPESLSASWIRSLLVDDRDTLWVGTEGGGLDYYDRDSDSFAHYRHAADDPRSLSSNRVRVVYQDRSGRLWVGTDGGGLNALDRATGRFERFQHQPGNDRSLPNDTVLAIHEDRVGNFWVGTRGGGLSLLDRDSGDFTHYQHDPRLATSLSDNEVRAIFEARDGRLWIGTNKGGLNVFNPMDSSFSRFMHDPEDPRSLSDNRVRGIFEDHRGSLWVATDRGLNEWRPLQQGFARYDHDPTDNRSLSDSRVTALFQDRGSVLWVGTHNGINHWNYLSDAFTYYQTDGSSLPLIGNVVTSVVESERGELWVASYGAGLSRINPDEGSVRYYRAAEALDQDEERALSGSEQLISARIMTLNVRPDHSVWIGTRGSGLSRLDPRSGSLQHYRHRANAPNSLSSDNVASILAEANGVVWVGTYGGGLNRLDLKTGTFEIYRHDPRDSSTIGSDRVLSLLRDRAGRLWIGTEDGGLNFFNERDKSFVRYQHDAKDPASLSGDTAWAIHEDRGGTLWVGTGGAGVNQWTASDRKANRVQFQHYGKATGQASDASLAILEDRSGFIWLSSNRGLVQLDPNGRTVRQFNRNSGLRDNEFNFGAAAMSRDGRLMFGGPVGLVSFLPEELITNRHEPDIAVAAFNRLGPLDRRFSADPDPDTLELDYREDLVTFEFAALDYAAPRDNVYRYRLEGFDEDWSQPRNFRRATYTNLPAGNYTFRVQAANNAGIWNEDGVSMQVRVAPAPWESGWAYAAYLLLALTALFAFTGYQGRQRALEIDRREFLEHQVQQRTSELAERNEQLEQVNDRLKEASWSDSLTGLKNRRYLDEFIEGEVALALRQVREVNLSASSLDSLDISPALSFMMIDLDGFKSINDTYGHTAGDHALLQARDVLLRHCRKSDTVIRWGGDEFLVISRNTSNRAAENLAERIRVGLKEEIYQLGGGATARLSGSIGFAVYPFLPLNPEFATWEQVVSLADQCAYLSKQNGRDAWVGVYGKAATTEEDIAQIKSDMEAVLARGRIGIRTSVYGKLEFSERIRRENV